MALATATAKATRDVDIRLAEKSAQVAEQELGRTLKANSLAADTYPANGQIRVFIEVENQNARFRPGMTVAATISR